MDQVQKLITEIQALLSGNTTYNTYKKTWRYLLESYIGGEEYKRANHLHRYQLETDAEYHNRIRSTPLQNHCASVVSVYNSFLFREPPRRNLGVLENSEDVQDFLKDADFDGRSLDNFMKDVATWSAVFGHAWVIVAKPFIGAQTRKEEIDLGVRPYVSVLTPLVVLDWEYQRNSSGRYQLSYLKYLEEVNGSVKTVKEWYTDWIRTIIVDEQENIILKDEWEVNELGIIPAVQAFNKKGVIRGIGISDLNDIADAQKFIYNATSEIDQSIRMDSHPSLVATPDTNVGTGSGALIHMPENLDPGLKPYLLEFSGASVDKILSTINSTIESIDKMANIGAVRATESRTMSGIAMQTEFELLNARLAEKADNLELAEEQIWKIFTAYQGTVWDGEIEYPGSFNIRDNAEEINQLRTATEVAGDNPTARAQIVEKLLDWLNPAETRTSEGEASTAAADYTYPDGEPIDPRLPDAYQPASNSGVPDGEACWNCAAYKAGLCSAWGNAPVRQSYWCAVWQPIQEGE